MSEIGKNVRQALRSMRRRPGFTMVILLSLALGIGATSAVFSIMNTLLVSPLPFADEERVVRLRDVLVTPGGEPRLVGMSAANYFTLKEQARSFADIGAQDYASFNLVGSEQPQRLEGAYVSWNVFPLLGVEPILGRGFVSSEDRPGATARVVVLGHDLWQRQFGGDRGVLGRQLRLNGESYQVIGVMPPLYQFPYDAELWVPLGLERDETPAAQHYLYTIARLAPDVPRERAERELATIAGRLARETPDTHANWELWIVPVREDLTEDVQARLLFTLLAAAAFLLLIACANTASMFLARALEQGRDLAVRSALGAARRHLVQQLVVHGLLLSLAGGALGLLLAYLALPPLVALSPIAEMSVFFQTIQVDGRVLAFTIAVSVLVGVLFSLVPAVRASRPDLQVTLKEEGRTTAGRGMRRLLSAFVVLEVAVAVVLLIGAGLMLRSLQGLLSVDPGFPAGDLLAVHLALPDSEYPGDAQRVAFLEQVVERVAALPGVRAADATTTHPLDQARVAAQVSIRERPPTEAGDMIVVNHRLVGPGYLETLGVRQLAGRGIEPRDQAESQPVAVVSRTFAEAYWPGGDVLGKQVKQGAYDAENPWRTVVGVVEDVLDSGDFGNTWYLPATQATFPTENVTLLVRAAGDPLAHVEGVRRAVAAVNPEQPIYQVATLEQRLLEIYGQERFSAILFTVFAGIGLALAVIGIYGILSYTVVQQQVEMGLRLALGAAPRDVLRRVLVRGLRLAALGALAGIAGALLLNEVLSSFLHDVSSTDPATYAAIAATAMVVAVAASYLPARRAARVDPIQALRAP